MFFKQWFEPDKFRLIELILPWFDDEKIISSWGYPVEICLVEEDDETDEISGPEDIGWFDYGEEEENLVEFSLVHINTILEQYDGLLEIQIEEEFFEEDESVIPVYLEGKIIINYISEDDEDVESI